MELPRNEPKPGFDRKRKTVVTARQAGNTGKFGVKLELYSLFNENEVVGDLRLEPNEAEDLAAMLMYYAQEARNGGS